jgi:hypothetical protein
MASNSRDKQEERMRELLEEKIEAAQARAENEKLVGRPAGGQPRPTDEEHRSQAEDRRQVESVGRPGRKAGR